MDYKVIEERKLKSAWPVKIEKDCDAFHNIDAEKELTAILAEQINREIKKNIMEGLQKCCLDSPNGVTRKKIKMTKLDKSCKNKSKPKQKEYFGDMRMENCDDMSIYVGNSKYKVHKTNFESNVSGVIYAKWALPDNVETINTNSNFNPINTKYAKNKINDTFYGDILTNNKI